VTDVAELVTIRGIAAGGDGVASLADGRTAFVPRAAPGDRVRLRNVRRHARFARADIAIVEEPGADRVTPICPHYTADRCGGCQLMHLTPEAQRAVKARIAGDAFRRIAHLDIVDPPVMSSPAQLGYRTKITFTMRQGRLGYHPINEPTVIFDVQDCLLADARLRALHGAVRLARRHLPADGVRVVLRLDRELRLHVIVAAEDEGDVWGGGMALHRELERAGVAAVVWWQPRDAGARAVAGADDPWPATVFEQVHPAMGRLVRHAALDALGDVAGSQAWDLYAGIGETTIELAGRGAVVASVERDGRAVRLAESLGPAGPRRVAGLVEDVARTLPTPSVIVTNPPRTGMDRRATDAVGQSGASRVAYISCDPATLARDVARLGDRYGLSSLQVFDQFPQTAHMECVALLERR
jgi:23S rRNA (uracil1939-C5)-methyltransferase